MAGSSSSPSSSPGCNASGRPTPTEQDLSRGVPLLKMLTYSGQNTPLVPRTTVQNLSSAQRREDLAKIIQEALDIVDDDSLNDFTAINAAREPQQPCQ